MPNRELDKVRLEPEASDEAREDAAVQADSADEAFGIPVGEYESDVSYQEVEGDYEVDAIISAQYRDSRKADDRGPKSGWKGWHYKLMWSGYLKAASDTEEGLKDFGEGPLLTEFWRTYGNGLPRGKKEPPKGLNEEVHAAPDWLLKKWFAQTTPRRSFNAFARRREREQNHIVKVRKTDSDYYINKARLAKAKARTEKGEDVETEEARLKRKAERKAAKREAKRKAREEAERAEAADRRTESASTAQKTTSKSSSVKKTSAAPDAAVLFPPSPPPKQASLAPGPVNAEAGPSTYAVDRDRRVSLGGPELATLDSDHEVDAVLGDRDAGRVRDSTEEEEEIEMTVVATQGTSKRKRIVSSPVKPDPGDTDGSSLPRKKKRQGDDAADKRERGQGPASTSSRGHLESASAPVDLASAPTISSSTTRAERLAASGKISKVDTSVSASTGTRAPSVAESEKFGEPQAGIFDAAPESEEEEEQVEYPDTRNEAESEGEGSLFAAASDDEAPPAAGPPSPPPTASGNLPQPIVRARPVVTDLIMDSIKVTAPTPVKTKYPLAVAGPEAGTSAKATTNHPALPSTYALSANSVTSQTPPTPLTAADPQIRPVSTANQAPPPSVRLETSTLATSKPASAATHSMAPAQAGPSTVRPPQSIVRPKYVQPTRLKMIDGLSDPEINKQAKRLGRQASPTGHIHVPRALQSAYEGLSPVHQQTGGLSPIHPSSAPAQTSASAPSLATRPPTVQARPVPKGPAAYSQVTTAPAGPRGWSAASYLASRPAPVAPRVMSSGNLSPLAPQPGSGQSPIWQQNATPSLPLPIITPAYNAANDPRRARSTLSQQLEQEAPIPSPPITPAPPPPPIVSAPPPPPPAFDQVSTYQYPHLKPTVPYPTVTPYGALPLVPDKHPREVIASCRIVAPLPPDNVEILCPVRLFRGTPSYGYRELSLQGFLSRGRDIEVHCETLDAFCLSGQLRHGAQIIEWAKVGCADSGARREYDMLKREVDSDVRPKIFAAYSESGPRSIDRHYAIVLAAARVVDFEGLNLERGSWQSSELDFVALLLSLPLDSAPTPTLPNPVAPEALTVFPKSHPLLFGPCDLADSFGLSSDMLQGLGKKSQFRFAHAEGPLDELESVLTKGFRAAGMVLKVKDRLDTFLIENARLYSSIRSTTTASALPRRTKIMSFGPSLSLLPSQWRVRTIWSSGGLVTFSPTFILRSPERFAELIRIIRPAGAWAAYVIPAVVEWANQSWNEPARCPDPTKTFEILTRSLFLDQHLLRFSGSAATSGGGLAVSICPPSIHQSDLCGQWMSWLKRITDEVDFSSLVAACRGVRPGEFNSLSLHSDGKTLGTDDAATELELVDIEQSQVDDLAAMRLRPDLLPYRRYIYVGEMSLDRQSRDRAAGRGVEFVSADDFVAVFSGAV